LLWNTILTTLIEQMHGEIREMIQKANQHKMMANMILDLFHDEVEFKNIQGYDDIKDIVRRALDAERQL